MALTDNILAYWNLNDDGSGNVSLVDSTGNSNTLTNTGGVTLGTGIIAGDAVFDYTGNQSLDDSGISISGDFTISMWVKFNSMNAGNGYPSVFVLSYGGINPSGTPTGNCSYYDPRISGSITGEYSWSIGSWDHYVMVQSGNVITTYLNGNLNSTYDAGSSYSANGFYIGKNPVAPDTPDAGIDEVGIWSRALSPTEVYNLYYNGTGNTYPFSNPPIEIPLTFGCQAYWNLNDDGAGNVSLADSTGNGYSLTNNNNIPLGTGIIAGDAVANGSGWLNTSNSFNFSGDFSVSIWANNASSIGQSFCGTPSIGVNFNITPTLFGVGIAGTSITVINNSLSIDNNWHNYVLSRSYGVITLYLDGASVADGPDTNNYTSNYGLFAAPNGTYISGSGYGIDEVGVWNRALSSDEVTKLYNSGGGLTYPFNKLYYNNANNNNNWGDLGNWWADPTFSSPATALPDSTNPVQIHADVIENTAGDGVCYCASAEFYSASFYYPLVLNSAAGVVNISGTGGVFDGTASANISVHDTCSLGENAQITGNATFRDSSTTIGTVNGNAVFHEQSYNYGHIVGNATVYYDGGQGNYPIGGIVDGTVEYLGWPAAQDQYFNDQATGSGAAGNWQDLNNWWADDTFTTRPLNSVGTQELPDAGTNIYLYAALYAYNTSSTINVNRARFYGSAYLNTPLTLNVSVDAEFFNYSGAQSVIYGDCYFYNSSYFYSNLGQAFVNGSIYLYDNSGIYQEFTSYGITNGGIYVYSLDALKNSFGYKFSTMSDGVVYNIPAGGGGGGFISRLLNLPWFIKL
jgi:hypothetical protein